jgi:predicted acyltransferase
MAAPGSESARLSSLDQFRGYTVLGMFVVNFVGGFLVVPAVLQHHHIYCSYADTIMPQFFFAVGFAYRLTLLRRLKSAGPTAAYGHVVRRNLGLILLGVVIYHLGGGVHSWDELRQLSLGEFAHRALKRQPFETLVHIGVASLWVLPVMASGPAVRVGFACLSGLLHLGLSAWFYYPWVLADPPGIDGGPLGFLTWTVPLLVGSFAYDVVASGSRPAAKIASLTVGAVLLMAVGYGLSCLGASGPRLVEPPFVPPAQDTDGKFLYPLSLWTMSQRAGSLSYLTFAAGFSLAVYALFYLLCDLGHWRLGLFVTLGSNALAGYILHDMVMEAVKPYTPKDAPLWYVLAALALYLSICYLFLRHLEKHKLFLRL